MDNNNHNENLTPDELVEKLKEKLALDRDAYSKIVEADEMVMDAVEEQDESVLEIDDDEIAIVAAEGEEIIEIVGEDDIVEIDEIDEVDFEIEDNEELADDSEKLPQATENEASETLITADKTKVIDAVDKDFDEDVELKDKIAMLFADFDELSDDVLVDDNDSSKIETLSDDEITKNIDDSEPETFDDTLIMSAAKSDNVSSVSDNLKKPTVYRFRKYNPEEEVETKLHSVVAVDESENDDNDKTKLNEIPELEKPDLNVMQTFGASVDHVRELFGDDVAEEYEQVLLQSEFNERQVVENEYVSADQNESIIKKFKDKIAKLNGMMLISGIACILLLILENIGLIGIRLGGILDSQAYPVSYIMICLQLLLICGAVSFSVLKKGVKNLTALEPSYYSVTFIIFCMAVLADVVSCFMDGSVILYNFCASIAVVFALVYEYNIVKRDYSSFKIISSDKNKTASVVSIGTSKNPEVSAYEQLEEDEEVKLITLQRGKFIKDFFARTKQSDSCSQDKILIPLTIAMMIVLFVLSVVLHKDYSTALKIANMSFSIFVPFAVYFSFVLPISKASSMIYENGSAIIGTAALEEYSGSSIICFEDKDVFPSYCVKLKSVKVYGDSRIDKILYNASSVFSQIGGPLSDVFSLSTIEIGTSSDVELVACEDDGIEAIVEGKRILIGKMSFLSKYGIFARNDESDDNKYTHMYIAEDEFLCAKFYIKYSLDVDFENVISRMSACGICGVLKTYDPNIDDDLLSRYIDTNKYPVRVVKCKMGEDISSIQSELNSGIVSISGAKNTVDATVTCERLYNIRSSSNSVKILAMIIGMIICAFITVFNVTPLYSVFVVLYQLLWTIPNIISARLYINR